MFRFALSLGSYLDFWIIFALLMTNATLGFIEEMNAQARRAAKHGQKAASWQRLG